MPRIFTIGMTLIAALCGCASHPLSATVVVAPAFVPTSDRFAAGTAILSGIDPLAASPAIHEHAHVLLGMVIRRSGVEQTRFIEIRVKEPLSYLESVQFEVKPKADRRRAYASPRIAATVRLLDADAKPLREAEGGFAVAFLSTGLIDFSRLLAAYDEMVSAIPAGGRAPPPPSLDDQFAIERGFTTILAFTAAMNRNSSGIFRSILTDFIGYRHILRALFARSFSLSTDGRPIAGTIRFPGIDEDIPAYTVPLAGAFGETTVVRCQLVAVRPVAPLTLTGGIVRVEVTRPDSPDDRITIQLLAARRGDPPSGP